MLHLFGGWYCFLFPLYLWTAQLVEKIHSKDPTIAPWLTSWKMSSLSRHCCASWQLLMISSQLRGWRPVLRTLMFAGKGLKPLHTQFRCVLIPTNLRSDCWDGGRVLLHGYRHKLWFCCSADWFFSHTGFLPELLCGWLLVCIDPGKATISRQDPYCCTEKL